MSRERSLDRAHVLLIGETGVGKSTFINYLCNYFQQGDLNHPKVAVPSKHHPYPTEQVTFNEWNVNDTTQSKTNACTSYIFTERTTGRTYLFLDTPGLSDTRGVEQNEMNVHQIVESIIQLGHLTAVIVVVNGAQSRLSSNLRSVIASLHDHLPDSILNNVIVLLTNVRKHQSTFDLRVLDFHGHVFPFYMQNGAFVSDRQAWQASTRDELQADWNRSMDQIQIILQTIDTSTPRSVDSCLQVRRKQYELKGILHRLRLEIIQLQRVQNELARLDGVRHQILEKTEIVDGMSYNMLCAVCNQVCQFECRANEAGRMLHGQASFPSPLVLMQNGTCQQGHCRCSLSNHYQAKKVVQQTRETQRDRLLALKDQSNPTYRDQLTTRAEISQILERILQQGIADVRHKAMKIIHICSSFRFQADFDLFINQLLVESDFPHDPNIALQTGMIIQRVTNLLQSFAENQEKRRRQQPALQIIERDGQSIERRSAIDVTHAKTVDLVEFYSKNTDPSLMSSVLSELHRRAQGKSTDPLTTPNDIMAINRYHQKHKDKTIQELSYAYRQLQKQINAVIQSDILQIVRVPHELLIENLSVQALLEEKEKQETDQPDSARPLPLVDAWPFPQPDHSLMPPWSSHSSPNLRAELQSSSPSTTLLGFSRLLSVPYPSPGDLSPMPPLPHSFSVGDVPKLDPTGLPPRRNTMREHKQTQSSSKERDRLQSMPAPPVSFSQMPQIQSIMPGFQAPFSVDHRSEPPSSDQSSVPDVIPPLSVSDIDQADFDSFTNTRLVGMYKEALATKNQRQQEAVHEELQRRCAGLYPRLLKEKEPLFREKLQMHQIKPVDKLVAEQAALTQKIHVFLEDGDVTLINDVPPELIVEAAVYAYLVQSSSGV